VGQENEQEIKDVDDIIAIAKYPTFSGEAKKRSDSSLQAGTRARAKIKQEDEHDGKQGKEDKSSQELSNAFTTSDADRADKTFGVYLTILAVLAGSVAISSLYLVLPYSVIDEVLLHRPDILKYIMP
jgi:hypothetical protein